MGTQIAFGDITADVVLKDIKNIHLSVYGAPSGPAVKKIRTQRDEYFIISMTMSERLVDEGTSEGGRPKLPR